MPLTQPSIRIGAWQRIPRSVVNVGRTKSQLTLLNPTFNRRSAYVDNVVGKEKEYINLWYEDEGAIYVPRAYVPTLIKPVETLPDEIEYTEVEWPEVKLEWRNEVQKKAYDELVEPPDLFTKGRMLVLGCGKGKAQPVTEPVLTPKGWKLIGSLRVGDEVIGSDGQTQHVEGVYPQGEKTVYRLHFTDGTWADCCKEHLWALDKRRSGTPRRVIMDVAELLKTRLRNKAGRVFYLPLVEPVTYAEQPVRKIDPYTLGLLLGDGGFRNGRVTYTTEDDELLEHFVLLPGTKLVDSGDENAGKARTYVVQSFPAFQRNPLHEELDFLGLYGKLSTEKHVPPRYKYATPTERLALLQGLFDTDGSATDVGTVEYCTASPQLCEDVVEMVQALGGTATVTPVENDYSGAYRVRCKLPKGVVCFRLARKQAKLSKIDRQREPYRALDRIEKLPGKTECVCIRVSNDDRLYVTRHHVVTHNTVISLKAAMTRKVPIAVIVDTNELAEQWEKELKKKFRLRSDMIGRYQGTTKQWKGYPIVIFMAQTLMRRHDYEYPEDFRKYFGLVIFDEVHVMAAPVFMRCATIFYGERWALTATPKRPDGLDRVYRAHIADKPCFTDVTQDLIPKVFYHKTGIYKPDVFVLSKSLKKQRWTAGEIEKASAKDLQILANALKCHIPRPEYLVRKARQKANGPATLTSLAANERRNAHILRIVRAKEKEGRKVLVIGGRTDQLVWLHNEYEGDSGLCHGKVPKKERMKELHDHNVVFAAQKILVKGFDRPEFDTIVYVAADPMIATENNLQQSLGRIQRELPGKREIEAHWFIDEQSGMLGSTWNKVMRRFKKLLGEHESYIIQPPEYADGKAA